MEFTTIRPGVQMMTLPEESANVILITGGSASLLVDTGSSHQCGVQIRQAIADTTDQPLTTVVLTHGHWDHAFGLSAFADLDTIGSENLIDDLVCLENQTWAEKSGMNLDQLTHPKTLLSLMTIRDLGGLTVEIVHFGPAHTRSDLVISIPQLNVILIGDLADTDPAQFDETSSPPGWIQTLNNIQTLTKPDTVIIPGHGTVLNTQQLMQFSDQLKTWGRF